jgi:hypothetical protein
VHYAYFLRKAQPAEKKLFMGEKQANAESPIKVLH